MINIGNITLHASCNYGSALQSFALKKFVNSEFKNTAKLSIINLQTEEQKFMYQTIFDKKHLPIRRKLKRFFLHKYKEQIINQANNFKSFHNEYLNTGQEYSSLEDLRNSKDINYDKYLVGSDQVWNFNNNMKDFDWSYLLEFTNSKNKYSYAASSGKSPQKYDPEKFSRFFKDIQEFKYVSVRDIETQNFIKANTNIVPELHIDPTLLLTKEKWDKYLSKKRLVNEKYIFLYHFNCVESIKIAKKISKELGIPIVIAKEPHKLELSNKFIKKIDITPFEFIQLIRDSELCISQSYHALIFSLLYNVPIIQAEADQDNRVLSLLNLLKLNPDHFNTLSGKDAIKAASNRDYENIKNIISKEQTKSLNYLRKVLNK